MSEHTHHLSQQSKVPVKTMLKNCCFSLGHLAYVFFDQQVNQLFSYDAAYVFFDQPVY